MLVRRELFHQGSSWLGQMGLGKLWQGPQQMEPLASFYFCAFKRNDHKRAQQKLFCQQIYVCVQHWRSKKSIWTFTERRDTAKPKICMRKTSGFKTIPIVFNSKDSIEMFWLNSEQDFEETTFERRKILAAASDIWQLFLSTEHSIWQTQIWNKLLKCQQRKSFIVWKNPATHSVSTMYNVHSASMS